MLLSLCGMPLHCVSFSNCWLEIVHWSQHWCCHTGHLSLGWIWCPSFWACSTIQVQFPLQSLRLKFLHHMWKSPLCAVFCSVSWLQCCPKLQPLQSCFFLSCHMMQSLYQLGLSNPVHNHCVVSKPFQECVLLQMDKDQSNPDLQIWLIPSLMDLDHRWSLL